MQIVYCYIKKYKSLANCEVNFGWKYSMAIDLSSNTLRFKHDPDYIEAFFSSAVENVTAIVGENGTGKSTVIDFLVENLTDGNAIYTPDAIIGRFNKKESKLVLYLGTSFKQIKILYNDLDFDIKISDSLRPSLTETDVIYYTNSFYDKIGLTNTQGLLNISLKSLFLYQDVNNEYYERGTRHLFEAYERFRYKEFWRIIKLIRSGLDFGVSVKLPKFIVLLNNANRTTELFDTYKRDSNVGRDVEIFARFTNYFDLQKASDPVDNFLKDLVKSIVYDYLIKNPTQAKVDILSKISLDTEDEVLKAVLGEHQFSKTAYLLNFLRTLLTEQSAVFSENGAWINILTLEELRFQELVNILSNNIQFNSDFISVGLSHEEKRIEELSSGEMALLTMLGRFYSLSNQEQVFSNLEIDKAVTIILDEGELYLHPSWQKKLINILVSTLPRIFNQKVQIILTSHSPFVLSDLPKSRVVFLVKENRKTTDSDILGHKQTFASNIHTLLADTFFLDNGFLGDFAKKVLDLVIKDLNSVNVIEPNRRIEIKKIIFSIGEPIIKRKLLEMYEAKFNLEVDERLSSIERRLGL